MMVVAAVLPLIAFILRRMKKTTVLKIRDARGFALKLYSGMFDQKGYCGKCIKQAPRRGALEIPQKIRR